MRQPLSISLLALAGAMLLASPAAAQPVGAAGRITTPKEQFGHNIGDDYFLANYRQFTEYMTKLDTESDRMKLVPIGKTEEGRTQVMAIVTSPDNHRNLDRYRQIARRLALGEAAPEEARQLAREGKAVVWIDGGLHATETLVAQQLIELVYQMVSRDDEEALRILDDVIILAVHANPDGMDLVSDWYMRREDPRRRSYDSLPRLYQKYIGHDNNRDFYMVTQKESENINRVMYREWFPQIMYNHHQTSPRGTIMFAPPFRDPFNYHIDPLIITSLDLVGAAMHNRFVAEGKGGTTMRTGASFSTWWNGGLRTTAYFHNIVGLLTETFGHPTPQRVPFVPERQLPKGELPMPIEPGQMWHFRQSVDYSMTANMAVLDLASRYRETFLHNIWRMARNSVDRGSRDTWTHYPSRVAALREEGQGFAALRDPALRDARAYVIPSDQADFNTATKFVNTLIKNGVTVHRAAQPFSVEGKQYPAHSFVVFAAQAFRPHVLDMFEPQDHPNDFRAPGGPPTPPYDNAGWTLAYQMGVRFDRVLEGLEGPFIKVADVLGPMPGKVQRLPREAGFLMDHRVNDSFIATNRLLARGDEVYWLREPLTADGVTHPAGTAFIPAQRGTVEKLEKLSVEFGLNFQAVATRPRQPMMRLNPSRIGLWDRYGGSMPSGWTRWILERFEYPFDLVFPQRLDAGNLREEYDVLIFVTGAIPASEPRGEGGPRRDDVPEEFWAWIGQVTPSKTVPQLKRFLEEGGTILTIGSSTSLADHLGLPLADHLVERSSDGTARPLQSDKYYVPGSVLRVRVDNTQPIAYGLPEEVDVMFDRSPVFRLLPDSARQGVRSVAWFDSATPLRSGWAWGQGYLKDGVVVAQAEVGKGRLYLFGPEVAFRAQPHGTFKFLFNGIHLSTAR
jgi:hypothetical protein